MNLKQVGEMSFSHIDENCLVVLYHMVLTLKYVGIRVSQGNVKFVFLTLLMHSDLINAWLLGQVGLLQVHWV